MSEPEDTGEEFAGVDQFKGETAFVLDKGFVRLVDYMGSDLSIVRSARVSYDADWRTGENEFNDERLIKSLMKRGHTSPFESVEFQFEVKAPIFIFRQWHRHRTQSYNEVSARYTELDEGFFVPALATITQQDSKNKQQRSGEQHPNAADLQRIIESECSRSFEAYKSLLARGTPRELARAVLPVAAYSRMFAKGNLHNWFRFLRERLSPGAQYEIKVYGQAILSLITPIVPVAAAAFKETLSE